RAERAIVAAYPQHVPDHAQAAAIGAAAAEIRTLVVAAVGSSGAVALGLQLIVGVADPHAVVRGEASADRKAGLPAPDQLLRLVVAARRGLVRTVGAAAEGDAAKDGTKPERTRIHASSVARKPAPCQAGCSSRQRPAPLQRRKPCAWPADPCTFVPAIVSSGA